MNISFGTQSNFYNSKYLHPYNTGASGIMSENNINNTIKSANSEISKVSANGITKKNDVTKTECETCKNRQYQDSSNDPGVSFKTATHIDPGASASAVMSHEQEHVSNESAKASAKGRKIVSQNVKLETSICPECGRTYVSGGSTTTVTKSDNSETQKDFFKDMFSKSMSGFFGKEIDLKA